MIPKALAVASIFAAFFFGAAASACVCVDGGPLAEQYRSADAVFIGRIIALEIETVRVEGQEIHHMVATFRVERRWKGPKKSKLRVGTCGTQTENCTCGINFQLGGSYVVFAKGKPLKTGSCQPTDGVESATETIQELEALK
jgi:hypothetical protein